MGTLSSQKQQTQNTLAVAEIFLTEVSVSVAVHLAPHLRKINAFKAAFIPLCAHNSLLKEKSGYLTSLRC